jgi:hypothetical protein
MYQLRIMLMWKILTFFFTLLLHVAFGQNRILFDASHAEMAANADWIPDADLYNLCFNPNATVGCSNEANPPAKPTPDQADINNTTHETYWKGALSAFAVDCARRGLQVSTLPHNGQITYQNTANAQDLSLYKVFVVCEPNIRFTMTEKTAILNWVHAGGGLLMISNHAGSDRNNDGWDPPTIWNDLMLNNEVQNDPFGFSFDNITFSQTTRNIIRAATPITKGWEGTVTEFEYNSGASITLRPDVNSTARGVIYKSGALQKNSDAMVVYARYGQGRIVATGDSSPIDDGTGDTNDNLFNGYTGDANGNHRKLFLNALIWLGELPYKKTAAAGSSHHAILSPNPTTGETVLQSPDDAPITRLLVTDLQGKIWMDQRLDADNAGQVTLSTANFPAGLYLLHHETGGRDWHTEKLVVLR